VTGTRATPTARAIAATVFMSGPKSIASRNRAPSPARRRAAGPIRDVDGPTPCAAVLPPALQLG
jgi:hypothetical protein